MISGPFPFIKVLGVVVHVTTMPEVLGTIDQWVKAKSKCMFVVATGMHGVMESKKNDCFRDVLNSANLFVPDGFSLVVVARLFGIKYRSRISGPDLMWEACRQAANLGHRVFFFGDTENTLKMLSYKLKIAFPDLKIAGTYSPPFGILTQAEDEKEISIINSADADILWVGLGLPKQEQWIYDHRSRLNVSVAIGVGAAFKFNSGQVRRAPSWIGNNGFEWLWRLIVEPKRVWRRVFILGPHFVFLIIKSKFGLDRDATR